MSENLYRVLSYDNEELYEGVNLKDAMNAYLMTPHDEPNTLIKNGVVVYKLRELSN